MSVISQSSMFYKDVSYYIKRKYKISPYIFDSINVDDPFGTFIIVKWTQNKQKYQIKISKDSIGAARLHDFMDLFGKGISLKYPELLL